LLFEKKQNWIDFDAGKLLKSGSVADLGRELFDYYYRCRRKESEIGRSRVP
jgi:altronate dehydratase